MIRKTQIRPVTRRRKPWEEGPGERQRKHDVHTEGQRQREGQRLIEEHRQRKGQREKNKFPRNETREKVMKLFEALLEGATTQDLLSLFESENTKRHTYMYDTSARRVNRPSGNTIPWLVLWILARFHPRRIWCGRALPSVQKFTEFFNSCTNRIRWHWYFRDKEKLNLSVIVPQKGNTSQCTHPVSPALESWPSSSRFASSREFAKKSQSRIKRSAVFQQNTSGRFWLRIFGIQQCCSCCERRRCGYSCNYWTLANISKLICPSLSELDLRYMKAATAYIKLTTRVDQLEGEEGLSRSLCDSVHMPVSSLAVQ